MPPSRIFVHNLDLEASEFYEKAVGATELGLEEPEADYVVFAGSNLRLVVERVPPEAPPD